MRFLLHTQKAAITKAIFSNKGGFYHENTFLNSFPFFPALSSDPLGIGGVQAYALDLLDDVKDSDLEKITDRRGLEKLLLNGARNWEHFSRSGCSLVWRGDIAERLYPPSQRDRVTSSNDLMTEQGIALGQAFYLIWQNVN